MDARIKSAHDSKKFGGSARAPRPTWQGGQAASLQCRSAQALPPQVRHVLVLWCPTPSVCDKTLSQSPPGVAHVSTAPSQPAYAHPARLILILGIAPPVGLGICRFACSLVLA
jgi:hypothetical protein